jgi:uncharacterized membrane protein HdeD (DUF308 family)
MENKTKLTKQEIYFISLIALTIVNATMFYLFGMKAAFNFVFYIIYFVVSTAVIYYLIFSIKRRKGLWWFMLLGNIYLTLHPLLLCLLIGVMREAYHSRIFY